MGELVPLWFAIFWAWTCLAIGFGVVEGAHKDHSDKAPILVIARINPFYWIMFFLFGGFS
jgi:hypothetical protein